MVFSMGFAIITSKEDPASMNIMTHLLKIISFSQEGIFQNNPVFVSGNSCIYTINGSLVHAENLDKEIDADYFVFASKHRSREAVPSLCCHVIGNWAEADLGGASRTLVKAPALILRQAFLSLQAGQAKVPSHQITLEATHHGPLLDKPVLFLEVGSSPEFWVHKEAAEVVAEAINNILTKPDVKERPIAIGIGGPHYASNFNKVLERTDICIGHICPKHMLSFLDEEMIQQALHASGASSAILDWKGMGKEKDRIKQLLDDMRIPYVRVDKII